MRKLSTLLGQPTGEKYFWEMRVGQLSLCSQLLLLPRGVRPMPAATCFTFSHSHDRESLEVALYH